MNQTQVIHARGCVWQNIRHPLATVAVSLKAIASAHQHSDICRTLISKRLAVAWEGLSIHAVEHGFWIEEVHLTGTTIHEELNGRTCLWWMMRRTWLQRCRISDCRGVVGE